MSVGLLEQESTGGATAREGFEYQDAFVLQNLPRWLAQSAFSHVASEAVGDVEACYFAPDRSIRRVTYEAKNHVLTAPEFWEEVERFKSIKDTSPLEFVRFVLVCKDYNSKTNPFVNQVRRLRGVGSSYSPNSIILEGDRRAVIEWTMKNGYREDLADFALDHVEFVAYAAESADSAFAGELDKFLPTIEFSVKQAARLRERYKDLIAKSSNRPVYRRDLEEAICEVLGADRGAWAGVPTRVHLLDGAVPFEVLGLSVGAFNGPGRATMLTEQWRDLLVAASGIGDFIKASTPRRSIALDSKQRMSAACLLGYAYGAARGFTLQVEHNGTVYRTDVHARADGGFFNESSTAGQSESAEGVVCIGFPTPVGPDISAVCGGSLTSLPSTTLESARAMEGIESLNLAVAEAKTTLVRFKSANRLSKLHLFVKAPSAFAMVLGHRLNGLCDVQLYDWVDGAYSPTVVLRE